MDMGCASSKYLESNSDSQSETTEFQYIDGRRYHNSENAVYHLPNDDDESDRLHMLHFLVRYIWQSNFSAPIEHILSKPGAKILDIGCGAGSWSFDIATTYPTAKIIGIDISSNQPTQIKPTNFEFIQTNALEGLPFEDNTFDFVFQRFLVSGYTKDKWPYVISEIVRVLKPGGFVELCEPSNVTGGGPVTRRLWNCEAEIFKERGCDWDTYQKLEEYLQNQGQMENIIKEAKKVYYSVNYNNDLGLSKAFVGCAVTSLVSLKPILTKKMQISNEEYDKLTKASEKELSEDDSYLVMVRVYASKAIEK